MKSKTEDNHIYSEIEAAGKLGIAVEELRWLVRRHFPDLESENPVSQFFRRTDLVLLAHLRAAGVPLASSTLS